MPLNISVENLSEDEARGELLRLAEVLTNSNVAYHSEDKPTIDDAKASRMIVLIGSRM